MDRKVELEKKRAQLEELRRQRQQRQQTQQASAQQTAQSTNIEEILKTVQSDLSEGGHSMQRAETVAVSPVVQLPRRQRKLQLSKLSETTCPPSERITYTREVQTMENFQTSPVLTYDESNRQEEGDATETLNELDKMPHIGIINEPEKQEVEINEFDKEVNRIKENAITEDERSMIINSENFKSFFEKYGRIMERAICEIESEVDFLTDYAGAEDAEREKDERVVVKRNREFFDDHWSRRRVVTSLNWSPIFPELMLASYHCNEDAPHEPDGVCLVWNLKYKKDSPEYVLHCQSALMSACMPNYHPSLVVGGTYSGQIVLWDIRTNKRTPIQRTPLSAACHTHPINQMTVIGTQNAHNLISISSDGKMCSWSLEMLTTPSETLELQRQAKTVALTSIDFFANDVNNFIVGSEDGFVYPGIRHGEKEKQGLGIGYEGHLGPISGVSCHKVSGPLEFPHLFLTSSFDWTVKLWSSRDANHQPIHSFEESGDYVYDVNWSPVHPGVFASADGEGVLSIWDLTSDVAEVPAGRCSVADGALNKVNWHGSGQYVATGDDQGRVHVLEVGEHIYQPNAGIWSQVAHSLSELQQAGAEQRGEQQYVSGGLGGSSAMVGSGGVGSTAAVY